jgi:Icc-related predicted phosphoesterase
MAGNPEWVDAIERFHPWMTISGHDHRSPLANKRWHHKVGQTICVNAGQPDPARLHYCLVEAAFGRSKPSLPSILKVTAFPLKATVSCRQA